MLLYSVRYVFRCVMEYIKPPLIFSGGLVQLSFTSSVKRATGDSKAISLCFPLNTNLYIKTSCFSCLIQLDKGLIDCICAYYGKDCLGHNIHYAELTLIARGPSYLGLTRSISWLLMPWLLTSPGYQQPWYWLYRICRSFSYLRKDFEYLCHINAEEWHKI